MNRKPGVLSALLFAFTGTAQAASQTITFEELGPSSFFEPFVYEYSIFSPDVLYLDGFSEPGSGYWNVADATSSR